MEGELAGMKGGENMVRMLNSVKKRVLRDSRMFSQPIDT